MIQTQLLIVDPPSDVTQRFRLDGDVAVLFTGAPVDVGLTQVQTLAGGVAHVRVGDHFLDLYAEPGGAIVYLPALGVLLGGGFGSAVLPPILVMGSDGSAEMDVLRLLARMLKTQHFQLFAPRYGSLLRERQAVMARLAEDVGYLHGLRRIAPALAQRQEPLETIERIAESLLPMAWRSELAQKRNTNNLVTLVAALQKRDPRP
ncbi:MAG: hypothetical protein IPK16_29400 [Anaerolineales bacterium]|nr:hypothetical protein [Anaerolineales bacterium]